MSARHASLTQRGRGPCARVACGHAEFPDHDAGYDAHPTYCAICGPDSCGAYRAPGRRRCARCGTPQNVHGSLSVGELLLAPDGICPWWVRPARSPLRALTRAAGVLAWAVGVKRSR